MMGTSRSRVTPRRNITFKGDAENLTALQFVGKYFYGAGNDVYGNDNADSDQVRTFADYLMGHLPQGVTVVEATGANGQVTLNIPDGQEGLYLIVENPKIDTTTEEFKGETVSRAMLTGTPIKVGDKLYNEVVNGGKTYKLGTLALKAEKVTLTKDVQGTDHLIQLNSVRTFTINTNVPNYTTDYPNWKAKNFIITDNPSANINPFVTESGNITFKGDAENLTALQFVGKYFYGAGNDVYGNDNADSDQVRTFADYLMGHLPQGVTVVEATGANGQVTLNIPDGQEGLYLIVENPKIDTTTEEFKGETVSRAMLTGTPIKVGDKLYNEVVNGGKTYKLGTLALKAEKVTLTKDVQGTDHLIQLNSVRTFTINTNVPNYTTDYPNWKAKNFIITDNPSANINPFVTESGNTTVKNLKVEASKADGTKTTLAIGTDYTVDATNANSGDANDFKISLTDPTKWSGQGITVTYDGVLTSTTPDGTTNTAQATVNDVQLDFSNNPNAADDKATLTAQEKLFNAQLNMEKVAFNDAATKLAGAKFTATVDGNPVVFTKSADGLTYTVNKQRQSHEAGWCQVHRHRQWYPGHVHEVR